MLLTQAKSALLEHFFNWILLYFINRYEIADQSINLFHFLIPGTSRDLGLKLTMPLGRLSGESLEPMDSMHFTNSFIR